MIADCSTSGTVSGAPYTSAEDSVPNSSIAVPGSGTSKAAMSTWSVFERNFNVGCGESQVARVSRRSFSSRVREERVHVRARDVGGSGSQHAEFPVDSRDLHPLEESRGTEGRRATR